MRAVTNLQTSCGTEVAETETRTERQRKREGRLTGVGMFTVHMRRIAAPSLLVLGCEPRPESKHAGYMFMFVSQPSLWQLGFTSVASIQPDRCINGFSLMVSFASCDLVERRKFLLCVATAY